MDSKTYWAAREAEALKHYITDEKEYDRQLEKIYKDMLDSVQEQIDGFYGRYAKAEGITLAEAKKRVTKADIASYERKAAKYVREKDFSKQANEEMRLYNATMKINRLEMLKANIGLELIKGHDELEKFMGDILQDRTEAELARQAGILGKTIRNNAAKAHAIVNGSFHNGTFSDRIWQYQDLMREDLGKLLQTGLIQGKNPRAIAKDLKKYWFGNDPRTGGGAKYCMERLMRTELARVQTEAQKQSFQRNGFDFYEFITNTGCCDICAGLNGKHFRVDKMMPGENAPPMHPNCRCSTAAWEDDAEYEAWLDYLANGGTTEEWNKLKDQEFLKSGENYKASKDRIGIQEDGLQELEGIVNNMDGLEKERWAMNLENTKFAVDNDKTEAYNPNTGIVNLHDNSNALTVIHETSHAIDKGAIDIHIPFIDKKGRDWGYDVNSASMYIQELTKDTNGADLEHFASILGLKSKDGWFDADSTEIIDAYSKWGRKQKEIYGEDFAIVSDILDGLCDGAIGACYSYGGHSEEYWMRSVSGDDAFMKNVEAWADISMLRAGKRDGLLDLLAQTVPNRAAALNKVYDEVYINGTI